MKALWEEGNTKGKASGKKGRQRERQEIFILSVKTISGGKEFCCKIGVNGLGITSYSNYLPSMLWV